ncbi:MAG TPA: response regulator [Candidatus Paceibacterota bacterium]
MNPDKKSILLVEDDKFLRNLSMKKLSKEGYEIIVATDGEEAVKIAETKTPNLILLDIILPGIDGYEVLRRIKGNVKLKNIPVILFTNLGQKEDMEMGRSLGAEDFLLKAHFTLDEVLMKIKKYI